MVDEGGHHVRRRPDTAWAKYPDALRRVSFARRSSRFLKSSSACAAIPLSLAHSRSQLLARAADLLGDGLDRAASMNRRPFPNLCWNRFGFVVTPISQDLELRQTLGAIQPVFGREIG